MPLHSSRYFETSFAVQKVKYFKSLKDNIVESDVTIQYDFAKNCSCVVQDAAQSFHWNNNQTTLLNTVYYYRQGQDRKNTEVLWLYQMILNTTLPVFSLIKLSCMGMSLIVTKNIALLLTVHHNWINFISFFLLSYDFVTEAEIHLNDTAHGKRTCDGWSWWLVAQFKFLATSLQSATNRATTTPKHLHKSNKQVTI